VTRPVAIFVGLAALLGAFALSISAAPADAKRPCWQQLIDDWYDGRIDGVYPERCYREAIRKAPEDIRAYSDLPTDLGRALQGARKFKSGKTNYVDAGYAGRDVADDPTRSSQGRDRSVGVPDVGRKPPEGPVPRAIGELGGGEADSIPIPLLALGGLALLLVASGGAGLVARRVQARRAARGPDA
jgi:hypothetical protein